jgi:hypothetical protein
VDLVALIRQTDEEPPGQPKIGLELARGIEPPTCVLQKPTDAVSSDQESADNSDESLDGTGEWRFSVIASSCAECPVVSV